MLMSQFYQKLFQLPEAKVHIQDSFQRVCPIDVSFQVAISNEQSEYQIIAHYLISGAI
jgi:hypothetical protein